MVYLIEVPLEGGGTIRVEADAPDGIVPAGRPGDVTARANATLQESLDRLGPVTEKLRATLSKLPDAPHKVTVEFGVKLSAEAGVVVAKGTSEANFAIRLEWGASSHERAPRLSRQPGCRSAGPRTVRRGIRGVHACR